MQKIFINKETDLVEQILSVLTENELDDNYFDSCYAVMDYDNKINAYNLRYNKESKTFEIVEGMKEREEVEVLPSEMENIKKENEQLRKEIEEIKNMITQNMIKE